MPLIKKDGAFFMPLFAKGRGLKKMKRTAENVKRITPVYEIIKIVKSGVTGRHLKQMLEDYRRKKEEKYILCQIQTMLPK